MWIYFLLMAWSSICLVDENHCNYKTKSAKAFVAIFPFFFLSAFRASTIGNDTSVYLNLYRRIEQLNIGDIFSTMTIRWEPGFLLFTKALTVVSSNPQTLLIVSSAFVYFVFFKLFLKYSANISFSIFLFTTMRFYFSFMSTVRQSIAIGIVCIAYDRLKQKKYFFSLFITLLASSFHLSAIAFVIIILLDLFKVKVKRRNEIFFIILSIIGFIFWDQLYSQIRSLLPVRYIGYEESSYHVYAMNLGNILNFILIAIFSRLIVIRTYSHNKKDGETKIDGLALYIVLCSLSCALFCNKFGVMGKILNNYSIFFTILLPNCLNTHHIGRYNKKIRYANTRMIRSGIIVLMLMYLTSTLAFRPEWQNVYPFSFCWD